MQSTSEEMQMIINPPTAKVSNTKVLYKALTIGYY